MDFTKIFNTTYLFERLPDAGFSWPIRAALLALFIGAIILAVISQLKLKKSSGFSKKLWYKLQVWGWSTGLVGMTMFYFREVGALYLSARFWLLLFLLIVVVWLIFILVFWKRQVPDKEEAQKKEQEYDKWLPKQK